MRNLRLVLLICLPFFIAQCRFENIDQPNSAQPGDVIEISITIFDDIVPEPNPHKGVLCMLVPQDWSFISGSYNGSLGTGELFLASEWADSAEFYYPALDFGDFMQWIAIISDTGYAYSEPISMNINIQLLVGQTEGCFKLGYLITKATPNIIGSSWSPLSYPHQVGVPDSCQPNQSYSVEPAPKWDALFNCTSGWTGSDAAYSVPISGFDAPSGTEDEQTLFLFGDTFIGEVDSNRHRTNSTIVRNTVAILKGKQPLPGQISFFWGTSEQNQQTAIFAADTHKSNPGDWIWPMDGVSPNDKIYVFGLRLKKDTSGWFFEPIGVTLISFTIDSTQSISSYEQVDTPLYYKNETDGSEIILGQAVMPMTEQSGNPDPDGYIYVYGPKNSSLQKKLVAARVLSNNIEDFEQWEYWDGENWSAEIESCAVITTGISQEFSVTPLDDGRFILVFQTGSQVAIRFGESPTGPFDFYRAIYDCPEVRDDPDIFVYNAKAHPHLSNSGELLISYNVNTFDFGDLFTNADIYRPRFITLQLGESNNFISIDHENKIPHSFSLSQNCPNPFNPTTTIKYQLSEDAKVTLKIYNMLGQEIRTLVNRNQGSGAYSVFWDGKNEFEENVCSGIYVYRLAANEQLKSRKMLFLK